MKEKRYTALLGVAALGAGLTLSNVALARDLDNATNTGFTYGSKDQPFWFNIGGVIKLDQTFFSGKNKDKGTEFRSGANMREIGLDFTGGFAKDFSFTLGFSKDSNAKVTIEDAYVTYSGLGENFDVSVGQVNPGYSLENTSSSKWIPFLERSMPSTALTPDSGLGFSLNKWSDCYSLNAAVTQPKAGSDTNATKSDPWTVSGRFTYALMRDQEKNQLFQIGVSGHFEDDHKKQITINTYPEARARNTGKTLEAVLLSKNRVSYDVELLTQNGPFSAELEYQHQRVNRDGNSKVNFHGYHAIASYVLTGEARRFKASNGTLGQIMPACDGGAWEISARHSYLTLNNKDVVGGSAHNTAVGLSWYANEHMRVMGNYIRSSQKQKTDLAKRRVNIFGVRMQVVF